MAQPRTSGKLGKLLLLFWRTFSFAVGVQQDSRAERRSRQNQLTSTTVKHKTNQPGETWVFDWGRHPVGTSLSAGALTLMFHRVNLQFLSLVPFFNLTISSRKFAVVALFICAVLTHKTFGMVRVGNFNVQTPMFFHQIYNWHLRCFSWILCLVCQTSILCPVSIVQIVFMFCDQFLPRKLLIWCKRKFLQMSCKIVSADSLAF